MITCDKTIILLGGIKYFLKAYYSLFFISSRTNIESGPQNSCINVQQLLLHNFHHHLQGINHHNLSASDLAVKLQLVLELSAGHKSNDFSS